MLTIKHICVKTSTAGHDYVVKPFSLAELEMRVEQLFGREFIEEHLQGCKRQLEEARALADQLTGPDGAVAAANTAAKREAIALIVRLWRDLGLPAHS